MILAGGQGSRLGCLTKQIAKPAVPFGGKYKIIDFALSNCVNSGVDTVGVLTQYQPHELSRYIGSGQPWDLDRYDGGVYILPPYVKGKSGEWYKGTANAIYQNIAFIEGFKPKDVLVLSSDHIYIMDYRKMIDAHLEKGADATIAVRTVPWEEASRLGIVTAEADSRISGFVEKPKKPQSNLASMGIYVFKWEVLKRYLIADEKTEKSSNDFGKNIIPAMLADGAGLYAHSFPDYWRDVGTVESYWQANMDLLEKPLSLDLYDANRRIYCRNAVMPPHYVATGAKITNSLISEGCCIYGGVARSVLFPGVCVGAGSRITNSVIFENAQIGKNCVIDKAIISDGAVIKDRCAINGPDGPVGPGPGGPGGPGAGGTGGPGAGGTGAPGPGANAYASEYCTGGISLIASGVSLKYGTRVFPNSMIEKDPE